MIRATFVGNVIGGNQYLELAGLSTDTKPTSGMLTGSLFHEVDTASIYAFDEVSGEWTKQVQLSEPESTAQSLSSVSKLTLQKPVSIEEPEVAVEEPEVVEEEPEAVEDGESE